MIKDKHNPMTSSRVLLINTRHPDFPDADGRITKINSGETRRIVVPTESRVTKISIHPNCIDSFTAKLYNAFLSPSVIEVFNKGKTARHFQAKLTVKTIEEGEV